MCYKDEWTRIELTNPRMLSTFSKVTSSAKMHLKAQLYNYATLLLHGGTASDEARTFIKEIQYEHT